MTSKLKVSVVIRAHNEAGTITDCLRSLQHQTVLPYEIIVVDNKSTDDTAKVAGSFSGVKVVNEPNLGLTNARNTGFNAAKGDVIASVDADCLPNKDWIHQIGLSLSDKAYAAATGPFYYFDMPLPKVSEIGEWAIRMSVKKNAG